jgi:predicted aspartyl protease
MSAARDRHFPFPQTSDRRRPSWLARGLTVAAAVQALLAVSLSLHSALPQQAPGATTPNGSAEQSEVPFEMIDALIVVQGRIGPFEGINIIIDTGTSPSVISKRMADKLDVRGKTGLLLTSNGAIRTETVTLSRIQIGALQADSIDAVVDDVAFLERRLHIPVGAIVGLDVVGRTSFLIDYRKKTITFGRVAGKNSLRFETRTPLVTVKASIAGEEFRLLADSGVSGLLLYRDRFKMADKKRQVFGEALVSTSSGETRSWWFEAPSIFLGTQNLRGKTVVVVDSAPDPRNDFDGLLGFKNLGFHEVSFDFKNGFLRWD